MNRRDSTTPQKLDTTGLEAPTSLSISDIGYILVGFSCGSIALYHQNYSAPLTIWYQACKYAITQIKWCLLYFQDDGTGSSSSPSKQSKGQKEADSITNVKFATRLCEFFAIDMNEDFIIWNM